MMYVSFIDATSSIYNEWKSGPNWLFLLDLDPTHNCCPYICYIESAGSLQASLGKFKFWPLILGKGKSINIQ